MITGWWRGALLAIGALLLFSPAMSAPANPPDVTIFGDIDRGDNQSYIEVPFNVPRGVTRITVRFEYDRANATVIDLGLMDQNGFRGWSGGNKSTFSVGVTEATPSYLPGPIRPGRWRLLLGVPNIREGVTAKFRAVIAFETGRAPPTARTAPYPSPVLNSAAGWYRGDLHLHTENSDGVCAGADGARGPCPLLRTLEAAKAAGLDFIAITDHNTTSQFAAMAALQPGWPGLLLIPGREITTFKGHANVLGPTAFIDFRRPIADIIRETHRLGGIFIINHPGLPSGESCMGCGWTWDLANWGANRADAVEVVNGGAWRGTGIPDGPFSGLAYWEQQLNVGGGLTAVGGSDNHDASLARGEPSAVGRPVTVVWARNLSTKAILEGIRSGRVFIDMDGVPGRILDFRATTSSGVMGQSFMLWGGAEGFRVTLENVPAGYVEVVLNGAVLRRLGHVPVTGPRADIDFELTRDELAGGGRVRIAVRSAEGRLLLLSNPIWFHIDVRSVM